MNRKIIFLDCDGTIFDATRGMLSPSDKTEYAIRELMNNGHLVFIASGRCKCLLNENITSLNPSGYLLTNGAYVEMNNQIIYEKPIVSETIEAVVEYCDTHNGVYYLESQDYIFTKDLEDPAFRVFVDSWGVGYKPFKDYLHEGFKTYLMMAAFLTEKECREFELNLGSKMDIRHQYGFSSFDVADKGNNKGFGVKKVLEALNIDRADAYAFGDGLNDLEMIQAVEESYAMENGEEKLKNLAKNVAKDVLDDGFYYAVVQEGLIKPIEE